MRLTRRRVLASLGLAGVGADEPSVCRRAAALTASLPQGETSANTCPFRLSVINDEITQDFEKACQIASKDFGLHWIELRSMWDKNVTELDAKQIADAQKILAKYNLRVTD